MVSPPSQPQPRRFKISGHYLLAGESGHQRRVSADPWALGRPAQVGRGAVGTLRPEASRESLPDHRSFSSWGQPGCVEP